MSDNQTLSKDEIKTEKPSMYKVFFWNDNYTPWNFVAGILVAFFNKTESEAVTVTDAVHKQGKGLAGVYTKDIADTKIEKSKRAAKDFGFPLKLTVEKE